MSDGFRIRFQVDGRGTGHMNVTFIDPAGGE
jgi:hypothetical protein